jgi:hypothetical protein
MFFFCAKHKICLGFAVLTEPESEKSVFDMLWTRFRIPPDFVIYDNGCNLSEFGLNREPEFMKLLLALVDGLHYKGHTNCSKAFDSRIYDLYKHINTMLAEQKNAKTTVIRHNSSFMSLFTFSLTLLYFTHRLNVCEMNKSL